MITMLGKVWYHWFCNDGYPCLRVRPQLFTYRIRGCDLHTELQGGPFNCLVSFLTGQHVATYLFGSSMAKTGCRRFPLVSPSLFPASVAFAMLLLKSIYTCTIASDCVHICISYIHVYVPYTFYTEWYTSINMWTSVNIFFTLAQIHASWRASTKVGCSHLSTGAFGRECWDLREVLGAHGQDQLRPCNWVGMGCGTRNIGKSES